ncbi:MAG: PEP-utilizing enzyme [Patescibacteria group bacterium]
MRVFSGLPHLLWNYKYIDHAHFSFITYQRELAQLYRSIHQALGGVNGYIRMRRKEYRKSISGLIKISQQRHNLTNGQLAVRLLAADDLYARVNSFLGLGTLYTDYLNRQLLKKYGKRYSQMFFNDQTSLTSYNHEVAQLASISNKRILKTQVRKILEKYYWLGSFFFIGDELTERQIIRDSKNIRSSSISKKHSISLRGPLVTEMKILSHDRNLEAEEFMKAEYNYRRLLKESARRCRLGWEKVTAMSAEEIAGCLRGDAVPLRKIQKRLQLYGFMIKNGKAFSFSGHGAKMLRESPKISLSSIDLRGQVAFGPEKNIIGRVQIVRNSADIRRFKLRGILVAHMTTPNYLPAIRKAAAIVTDEGGLTCHAAIIARELKKPCIIGTKIATLVLKNGDKVEVDANKGIIIKINKNA